MWGILDQGASDIPGMWGILGCLDAADPGLKLSGMRGTSPPAEPASSKSLGGHLWAGIPPARGARFRPFEQRRHDPGHPPACGAPRPAVHALPPDGVSAVHLRNTAPGDLSRYAGHPILQKPLAAGYAFRVSRASAGHAGLVADLPRHTGGICWRPADRSPPRDIPRHTLVGIPMK